MAHLHCKDYTRGQALRAAVAKAGDGLPAIEPGMPVPAGTGMSRRSLLLRGLGLGLAVYGAGRTVAPQAFEAAVAEAAGSYRTVVSIFMDGGADAMSLMPPAGDPRYAQLRPTLQITNGLPFDADSRLSWHPDAAGLKELWDDATVGVAVAPAIGYDSPNQSHFTSRHFWEVGALDPVARTGWLGRYLDRVGDPNVPIQGLSFAGQLSPQLATSRVAVAAARTVPDYKFASPGVWGQSEARMRETLKAMAQGTSADVATAYAIQSQRNAAELVDALGTISTAAATDAAAAYPATDTPLRNRLQQLAQLLAVQVGGASLPIRAVTVNAHGGYDTHASQAAEFAKNVRTTADNVRAFWKDLQLRGLDDRVVILLWSEFGRRPKENGSAGTDHGAAGSAFVIGKTVRQGLVGEFPGLDTGLDRNGNLRNTADFRGVYAALLEQWYGTVWSDVLPSKGSFAMPQLF